MYYWYANLNRDKNLILLTVMFRLNDIWSRGKTNQLNFLRKIE